MSVKTVSLGFSKIASVTVIASAALVACGKKEAETPQTALPTQENSSQEMAKAAGDMLKQISPDSPKAPLVSAVGGNVPSADTGKALTDYQPVNSGVQLAYLYYALSGLPVDYEKRAGIASQEYR